VFPTLIRKTEPKPLRVFLQDGYKDQNIYGGNWWIANQAMLSALQFSGYEVTNKWGTGGHDGKQGGSIFPEAMRWLWAGYPAVKIRSAVDTQQLAAELIDGPWQLVGQGYQFPGGLAADAKGEVFFTDQPASRIYKVALDGAVSILRNDTSGAQALAVAPDGRMFASQPAARHLVELEGKAGEKFISTDVAAKAMVVAHSGVAYLVEPGAHAVKALDAKGKVATLDTGIEFPSGVTLSPDQTLLYVSDLVGQLVYSFQIQPDGSLAHKQRYFHLHMPDDPRGSGADGLCVDVAGRLYVASSVGVQFCDQAGRVNGILNKPEPTAWASSVCFGGKNRDELFLAAGDKVWKRKLKVKGALPFEAPIVPPAPRL
jgi:sugar lactone lactonase YvrE